ncbi:hypothetical protein C4B63_133g25 [Trypanosoma cruzi]|uniref:Uncharacterized protein n=1 Tax=Trypanosoma cruzi TaxID=5693 RepID=A0A2V2USI1_TRYCR|nr:hypothetical protein C4B63_133g25 [Trypanosoma cruzi]
MGCGNSRCGKAKDLSGEHLKNRTEVRSDCWPCARKSTFVLEREELSVCGKRDVDEDDIRKPVINLSSTSEAVKAVVAFESPRIPVEAEEHLFLVPNVGDKKEARESESSSSYIWRCRVCDKVKPLAGQHLNGKTEVRSDCWPCAAKRTFYRTATQNKFTAKPPAGSPFKSVFGAPSSTAAKPPAESPSRACLEHRLRLLQSHPRSLLSRACLGHRLRLMQSHPRSLLSRTSLGHRLRLLRSHPRSLLSSACLGHRLGMLRGSRKILH